MEGQIEFSFGAAMGLTPTVPMLGRPKAASGNAGAGSGRGGASVSAEAPGPGAGTSRALGNQAALIFEAGPIQTGYTKWLSDRRLAMEEVARTLNLPLGHQVEIWLVGGIRLRGTLKLREEILFLEESRIRRLELAVDRATFTYRDIESCIRLD